MSAASGTFRVLSIDGGGIRGILPARVLTELEDLLGAPISSAFDLIVGTSTGGILGLGLAAEAPGGGPAHTAKAMEGLYRDRGPEIFSRGGIWSVRERIQALGRDSALYAASAKYLPD